MTNSTARQAWDCFRVDASRWLIPESYGDPDEVTLWRALSLLVRYRQLRPVAWFRLGSWGSAAGIRGMGWLAGERIQGKYGLDLPVGTSIGPGFYLAHPTGVAITVNQIGAFATLIGALTIGINGPGRAPTIGDRVFVGAGARIIGDVNIGNDVVVGANAVVNRDVPDNLTMVGVPAKPTAKSRLAASLLSERINSDGPTELQAENTEGARTW